MPFEGFETTYTETPSGAHIFAHVKKTDSELPVLVLLHGFPQNSLIFKEFVKEIPPQWPLLVPDLPGYGNSTKPIDATSSPRGHSKKEMGKDILAAVDKIFGPNAKFIPYGYGRGGRVAYRLAFDCPERVVGVAVLDILPTIQKLETMSLQECHHRDTINNFHWIFMSVPAPLPETMINSNPKFYFESIMRRAMGTTALNNFDNLEWVRDCIEPYLEPEKGLDRIAAACEDYRASAILDVCDDLDNNFPVDALGYIGGAEPARFRQPLLFLHRSSLDPSSGSQRSHTWETLTQGKSAFHRIGDHTTGHYLVNERQEETGQRTREWLAQFESS